MGQVGGATGREPTAAGREIVQDSTQSAQQPIDIDGIVAEEAPVARDLALARDLARAGDLDGALKRALMAIDSRAAVRVGERGGDARKATSFLCRYIVLLGFLVLTFSFWFREIEKWSTRKRKELKIESWKIDTKALDDVEAYCQRLLENFGELRRRVDGESEAWEGIRIVRERKVEGARAEAA